MYNPFFIFAIIHIRIIQYRYKKITLGNCGNHTNSNIAKLKLLQAKEYYYHCQFSPNGKYLARFAFSNAEYKAHLIFMNWLFPIKDFKEWEIVIWHNPEAITYYQNKIFNLQKGVSTSFENEITAQILKWRKERYKLINQ